MSLRSLGLAFLRSERGVAAIEFAFAAPVLLLLSAGVYEFSSVYQDQSTVDKLASQYAIAWADCADTPAGVCNSELSQYNTFYAIRNVVPQLNNPTTLKPLTLRMAEFSMNGTSPSYPLTYSSQTTMTSATNSSGTLFPPLTTLSQPETNAASATLSNGQVGVVVTVTYTHQIGVLGPLLNGALATSITMTYTVVQIKNS